MKSYSLKLTTLCDLDLCSRKTVVTHDMPSPQGGLLCFDVVKLHDDYITVPISFIIAN